MSGIVQPVHVCIGYQLAQTFHAGDMEDAVLPTPERKKRCLQLPKHRIEQKAVGQLLVPHPPVRCLLRQRALSRLLEHGVRQEWAPGKDQCKHGVKFRLVAWHQGRAPGVYGAIHVTGLRSAQPMGRADEGQALHPMRMLLRQHRAQRSSHGAARHVHTLQSQAIHERQQVAHLRRVVVGSQFIAAGVAKPRQIGRNQATARGHGANKIYPMVFFAEDAVQQEHYRPLAALQVMHTVRIRVYHLGRCTRPPAVRLEQGGKHPLRHAVPGTGQCCTPQP